MTVVWSIGHASISTGSDVGKSTTGYTAAGLRCSTLRAQPRAASLFQGSHGRDQARELRSATVSGWSV